MSTGVALAIVVAAGLALLALRRGGESVVTMPSGSAPGAAASVEAALAAGRKIEAIKLYREEHGVGLREAKDAVEALQQKAPGP